MIETTKAEVDALIESAVAKALDNQAKTFETKEKTAPKIENMQSRDNGLVAIRTLMTVAQAKEKQVDVRQYAEKIATQSGSDVDYQVSKGLNATDFVGGGALVPESMSSDVIPSLMNASVFYNNIPKTPMPTGSLTIPKVTGAATKYWSGENPSTKASKPSFGTVTLNSKQLSVIVPISKNLIMGASVAGINPEQIVLNELTRSFLPDIESQILRGSGVSNELLGIYNRVPSANKFNSAGVTFANVVADAKKATSRILTNNVPLTRGQWVMSTRSGNHVRFLPGTNSDDMKFMTEINAGRWLGKAFGESNYIPNTLGSGDKSEIYLFDLDQLIFGIHENLSISTSEEASYYDENGTLQSAFVKGMMLIKMQMSGDFAMFNSTAASVIEAVAWE